MKIHKPREKQTLHQFYFYFFAAFLFLIVPNVKATHIVGADMSYRAVGNNRYVFILNVYRDCGSTILLENKQTVYYYSINCNIPQDSLVLTGLNDGVGVDISPVCSQVRSNCKGGTTPGVEKFTFTDTVTLNTACSDWIFYYKECNRSAGILTVVDPQLKCLYIEARLNNLDAPNNSSPTFENEPVAFVCLNRNVQLNNGTVESDGDQLKFRLVPPRTNSALPGQPDNNFLVYKSPYSATSPLPTAGGFNFDSTSGTMTFNPTLLIRTVTALKVEEYRNGKLIGSVMRDLQILVRSCTNNVPTLKGVNGSTSFEANLCAGVSNQLYFPGSDLDPTDSVTIRWTNPFPGASLFATKSRRRDSARFIWTPTIADTGLVLINLTITDNSCPTIGSSSASYKLNVKPSPKVVLRSDTSLNCGVKIPVTAQIVEGRPPFTVKWSGLPDTTRTVLLGNGNYVVTIEDDNGCTDTDDFRILGGSNASAIIKVDSLCVGQLSTIKATVTGQPTGVTFSYQWQVIRSDTVPSLVVFTSTLAQPQYRFLKPGQYDIFLTLTGSNNCSYNTTQTINICSPPPVIISQLDIPCLREPVKIKLESEGDVSCSVTGWTMKFNTLSFTSAGPIASLTSDSFKVGTNRLLVTGKTSNGCTVKKTFDFLIKARPSVKFVNPSVPFRCNQAKTSIVVKAWKPANLPLEKFNLQINCPDTNYTTGFFTTDDTVYVTINVRKPQTINVIAKMDSSTCTAQASGTVFFPISSSAFASPYCVLGDTIRFSSNPTSPFGIRSFIWDLADGDISTLKNPKKLYPVGQIINVTLLVEDSSTCKDTIAFKVDTRLPDTLANVIQDTICFSTAFNFTYGLPDLINSWTWKGVSDSTVVSNPSGRNGSLILKTPGINPISVRIKYKNACVKRWLVDSVFVRNPVDARFQLRNVCSYDSSRFTGFQVNGEFPIEKYGWEFSYPNTTFPVRTDTGDVVYQVFNKNGPFRTKLWARNIKGCTDTYQRDTSMVLVSTPSFDISGTCQGDSLFFFFGRVPDVYENIRRFNYFFGDGATTVNENGFAFHQYPVVGVYKVKLIAYSKEGCLNTDSTELTIKPRPNAVFNTGLTPCLGSLIPLNGSASTAATPTETLIERRWYSDTSIISNEPVSSTRFLTAGTHVLAHWVKSENGCTDMDRYVLNVLPVPTAGFDADPQQLLTQDFLTFTNTSQDGISWTYQYGDGKDETFTDPALASPVHYYSAGGEFHVLQIVKNEEGCSDTASTFLRLKPFIALPSAFTPNDDDRNDALELEHRLIRNIEEYKIFNRFGEVVFETKDLEKVWDGKQNGSEVPAGSYLFTIKVRSVFGETIQSKGTVNLIR
ncbi:MAG TPA: PKD domain-containing protein [Catalimonadaceae bacterium]|nr:PKD domain-containing protein [Catalimonadaceae bacterium]